MSRERKAQLVRRASAAKQVRRALRVPKENEARKASAAPQVRVAKPGRRVRPVNRERWL